MLLTWCQSNLIGLSQTNGLHHFSLQISLPVPILDSLFLFNSILCQCYFIHMLPILSYCIYILFFLPRYQATNELGQASLLLLFVLSCDFCLVLENDWIWFLIVFVLLIRIRFLKPRTINYVFFFCLWKQNWIWFLMLMLD